MCQGVNRELDTILHADLSQELGYVGFHRPLLNAEGLYCWKSKYGGMEVGEAQRLRSLEDENRRLKHWVADLSLDKEALKAIVRKKEFPNCAPSSAGTRSSGRASRCGA